MEVLSIQYQERNVTGVMSININRFMDSRNISKFKKLLKVIDMSAEKEKHLAVLKSYILNELEQIEPLKKECANKITAYTDKIPYATKALQDAEAFRGQFKRNSKFYRGFTPQVKQCRKELALLKSSANRTEQAFNNLGKKKLFMQKCLEILESR